MNLYNDFQVSVYVASISSFLITAILCFLLIKYISNFSKSKNTQKRLNDFNIVPLGGVAMAISFFISVRLLGEADPEIVNISIFALAISLLGVLDDFFDLNWKLKLFFQLIFVSLPIYILDQKINLEIFIGIDFGGRVNFVFTIFWVITLMNSINFIDNMDGFAAINCSFICLATTILSFVFNQNYLADISFVLFASISGFILFNYPPAKIYMGDSGSLFIGFVFGFISILFNWNPTSDIQLYNSIAPVFLFFTIPILDFLTVFYHRIKNNISPTTGGTDHISHRLLKKGLSVRKILYLFIGLNIIVFLTIAATIIFDSFANIAFLSYIIIISYLFFYFQKLEPLN
tara:strand:+ start:453 stop:1490 length:1038 start_codon:yes stop_codon:yes gene_type:complete